MGLVILDFAGTLYDCGTEGLYEDAERFLAEVHGKIPVSLITLYSPGRQVLIERLELRRRLDNISIVPEKRPFHFLSDMIKFWVSAENCLVIGDDENDELRMGTLLGCRTLLVNRNGHESGYPSVANLDEALAYLPLSVR
ncbi:hypothetical protein J4475_01475 [Candidatus Woesearchaeota archaeon]|nr:hypothetical protein [Candidatus Woesearchaeota archaeon]